jgi:hypothetical protein
MNISDAAVEAAAKWLHDNNCRSAIHSGHPADMECYGWREEARELLETAAPHIMSEAWDDGHDAGFTFGAFQGRVKETPNPYRDAVAGE